MHGGELSSGKAYIGTRLLQAIKTGGVEGLGMGLDLQDSQDYLLHPLGICFCLLSPCSPQSFVLFLLPVRNHIHYSASHKQFYSRHIHTHPSSSTHT